MADDLDRAINDYAQRAKDRESGLPQAERERLIAERARRAEEKRKAEEAAKMIWSVEQEIGRINTGSAGRIPRLVEVSRGGSELDGGQVTITQAIGFGLQAEGGGYEGQTLTFSIGTLGDLSAYISAPPGQYDQPPQPARLGTSPGAYDFWVRDMVAAYLDQKIS